MSREQLAEAIENAVIFDRRDDLEYEVGRAARTSAILKAAVRLIVDGDVRGVLDLMGKEYEESQVCIEHHTDFRGYCTSDCQHMPTIVVRVEGSDQ